jgi:rubrerythrin
VLCMCESRTIHRGVSGAVVVAGIVVSAWGATAAQERRNVREPAVTQPQTAALEVGDTRANLQTAFDNEINAKERYLAAAKQADREGYPYVAQLFRACARAEQVHADQHVHAIAVSGGEARALLQRLSIGTTPENLRVATDLETYEATQLYPALLAKARAEHLPAAVRSIGFALAAEREHVRLLTAAQQTLDQRLAVRTFFVCPGCGRTVETRDARQCPNCFTSARRFIRVM